MSNQLWLNSTTLNPAIASTLSIVSQYKLLTSIALGTSGTPGIVVYDTAEITDPSISYSAGTFTCNQRGIYTFSFSTVFAANSTGFRQTYVVFSSSTRYGNSSTMAISTASTTTDVSSTFTRFMNPGNTVQVFGLQNSGGSLNLVGSADNSTNYCLLTVIGVVG